MSPPHQIIRVFWILQFIEKSQTKDSFEEGIIQIIVKYVSL